jgi:hypothetical protein
MQYATNAAGSSECSTQQMPQDALTEVRNIHNIHGFEISFRAPIVILNTSKYITMYLSRKIRNNVAI